MSQSGNALLALVNKSGSNRKIKIKHIGVLPHTHSNSSLIGRFQVSRVTTVGDGTSVTVSRLDTESTDTPPVVKKNVSYETVGDSCAARGAGKRMIPGGALSVLAQMQPIGRIRGRGKGNVVSYARHDSGIQGFRLAEGESLALLSTYRDGFPLQVMASIRDVASGDEFSVSDFVSNVSADAAIMTITNPTGSGRTFEVREISAAEFGTTDTPYIQIVPIGGIDPEANGDTIRNVVASKMDSEAGDAATYITAMLDVPLITYGVPTVYLAEGSAGSPKGVSYLQTKDFIGPSFGALFPERRYQVHPGAANPDGFLDFGLNRLFRKRRSEAQGIQLNPGDGIALASAAETAAITTAVGLAGWLSFELVVDFDIDPLYTPNLTLVGLQDGSDIVILEPGTETEVVNVDANSGSTYSYQYDFETLTAVDIAVFKVGYVPFFIRNLALTQTGVSVPISQVADRNYLNA